MTVVAVTLGASASSSFASVSSLLQSSNPLQKDALLPVEEAFDFSYETSKGKVYLNWSMPDGYYLYKDKFAVSTESQTVKISEIEFSTDHQRVSDSIFGDVDVFYRQANGHVEIDSAFDGDLTLSVSFQGCASGRLCYPPETVSIDVFVDHSSTTPGLDEIVTDGLYVMDDPDLGSEPDASVEPLETKKAESSDLNTPKGIFETLRSSSFIWTVALFFMLGAALTFTPCVLPMIPIISSIIVGSENQLSRKRSFALSMSYVAGMALVYTSIGIAVGAMGSAWNLQAAVQTPWILGVIATLFLLLALAMFDVYEIRLPRFLTSLMGSKREGGSVKGVFVAGGISALVVSPCVTAPLAGTLIYLSTTSDYLLSGAALLAISLGMGLPLVVIGTFGRDVLPKSGPWMVSVKYFFGFMLTGMAIWMISRVLPSNVSLFLWGALGIGLSVFLFDIRKIAVKFKAIPIVASILVLLWSAFLIAGSATGKGKATLTAPLADLMSEEVHKEDNLFEIVESQSQLQEIIGRGKPVLVDVYADWCISCLVMDKEIFATQQVRDLREQFTFVKFDMSDFSNDHKAFLNKNALIGPPALVFYYRNGDVIEEATLPGEIDLEIFLDHIKQQVLPFIDQN